ncbi:cytosine permease, partial [Acinetobacter baumannii]|uniref:cytosine permease n=1 Tax=Acinetobacter baumannii TaxID=470 RepID=UPI003AF8C375
VVSYFSGPMLYFGVFSRYGKSFNAIKMGIFLGLPINFLGFSLLTVVCIAATLPLYGKLITDPVEMVGKLDNPYVFILGRLTIM